MITDLLATVSHIKRETDEPVDVDAAVETAVEHVDRGVSEDEKDELRDLLNGGWLDE